MIAVVRGREQEPAELDRKIRERDARGERHADQPDRSPVEPEISPGGGIDPSGSALLPPRRAGRSPQPLGRQGLAHHRGLGGGTLWL